MIQVEIYSMVDEVIESLPNKKIQHKYKDELNNIYASKESIEEKIVRMIALCNLIENDERNYKWNELNMNYSK